MEDIVYPDADDLKRINKDLLENWPNKKKADKYHVMSPGKLLEIINEIKAYEGDIYDKAAVLMIYVVQKHAFASGNRRTAYFACKEFVESNKKPFSIIYVEGQAKIMTKIRQQGFYSVEEIKVWIETNQVTIK